MPDLTPDLTHASDLMSWVDSANAAGTDFPIQNLPYGVFRQRGSDAPFRTGVAIGQAILDLPALARAAPFEGLAAHALAHAASDSLNALMALTPAHWSALPHALSTALRRGSPLQPQLAPMLADQAGSEYRLPAVVGDYTDFYISHHHASAVGRQFRPGNPLLPNYQWIPIGYHGRASSLGVDQSFPRPVGQTRPEADGDTPPFGPTRKLDYELEVAIYVGAGNAAGTRIGIADAESNVFGLSLLNDWSARDIQAWEYQPLGPFLGKSFASTLSPWVVTLDALMPYRLPFERAAAGPAPLPYLTSAANDRHGAFDIGLEVALCTEQSRASGHPPAVLSRSNFKYAYWTAAQLIAHHTVNGCNLRPGDLLGSGTMSGPRPEQAGSLLELTDGGKRPIDLPWGESRVFLQDGDQVILSAHCERPGAARIGFGLCVGTVLAANHRQ